MLGNFVINCSHMDNISLGSRAYSFVCKDQDMAMKSGSLLASSMSAGRLSCSVSNRWMGRCWLGGHSECRISI